MIDEKFVEKNKMKFFFSSSFFFSSYRRVLCLITTVLRKCHNGLFFVLTMFVEFFLLSGFSHSE